ncbi:unnamed protein product [Litomosoides sigmodontis]|uniref:C2H2-type domain-containing protein n=1 Tax=Litomosoides sigmodontis TaxID=42156 RepID=A0A3P6T2R3_LITSI|nr:unnamed protein product [Litomosoides sigmodontis]
MSSLKALLNSKSFDSVTTSNHQMTSNSSRKRGAVLEEWLLRKFPELYRKSHDLESSTGTANDVENQPLNLVKRNRPDAEVKDEEPKMGPLRTNGYNRVSVQRPESKHDIISNEYYVLPKGDLFILKNEHLSKRLDNDRRASEYVRVVLIVPPLIEVSYEGYQPKSYRDGDFEVETDKPINLSLSKRRKTVYLEWSESESNALPVLDCEVNRTDKQEDARSTSCSTVGARYRGMNNKLQSDDKRTGGRIYSLATNKQIAKRLTTPKLTKHNDAAYYPNIQCLLCREWVCSRNRYMHVESHLQYRPYKCSFCGYDNRKEIFIILHIKKVHGGRAEVIRDINTELEHEVWDIAERCVEHTRDVLQRAHQETIQDDKASMSTERSDSTKVEKALLSKYSTQYRPRLYNTQRAEKSLVIEDSLKMGIVPDFSEVSNREVKCQFSEKAPTIPSEEGCRGIGIRLICNGFVISHVTVMEEHTRSHLTQPSYRCSVGDCTLQHHSKNFLTRHMKEVHKYKHTPTDIVELDPSLKKEFCKGGFVEKKIASQCFPNHFSDHLSSLHILRRSPVSRSPLLKSLTETNWCIPSTTSAMRSAALSMSAVTSAFKTSSTPSLKPTSSLLTAILPFNLTLQTALPSNDVALLLPKVPISSSKEMPGFNDLMSVTSLPVSSPDCKPFLFRATEHSTSKCVTLTNLLAAAPKNNTAEARVQPPIQAPISRKTCSFCQEVFEGEYLVLYKHVKQHLSLLPYECSVCKLADVDRKIVEEHISNDHSKATLIDRMTDAISRQCSALFTACFPDVPLQPSLHDNVQK